MVVVRQPVEREVSTSDYCLTTPRAISPTNKRRGDLTIFPLPVYIPHIGYEKVKVRKSQPHYCFLVVYVRCPLSRKEMFVNSDPPPECLVLLWRQKAQSGSAASRTMSLMGTSKLRETESWARGV